MDQTTLEGVISEIVSHSRIVAPGWRNVFIDLAWMKAVVERCPMEDWIDSFTGDPLPIARTALALIPPLNDTSMEIVAEARKLDPPGGGFDKSWELLASDDVFATLLRLNPGLAAAIVAHQAAPAARRPPMTR